MNPFIPAFFLLAASCAVATVAATAAAAAPRAPWEAILPPGAAVEEVVSGLKFLEGPVWMPDGHLLFSDIDGNTIYRLAPGGKPETFRTPSGHSNGLTVDRQGRLIACEHDRRVSRTEKDGRVVTLADRYEGKRLNSPNDVVVRRDASVYFTDPPYGIKREQEELGFYGVYRWKDGKLTLLVNDFVKPNGLAFSPDEKRLYVDDTDRGHIRVFDVKPDGTLANGKVFAELKEPGKRGAPDGMKVDARGNVYCTGPGGVWVFAPDGTLLGKIPVPKVATNVAFGGPDRRTLYITAQDSLYRIVMSAT